MNNINLFPGSTVNINGNGGNPVNNGTIYNVDFVDNLMFVYFPIFEVRVIIPINEETELYVIASRLPRQTHTYCGYCGNPKAEYGANVVCLYCGSVAVTGINGVIHNTILMETNPNIDNNLIDFDTFLNDYPDSEDDDSGYDSIENEFSEDDDYS